ncbi:hypothetical protein [Mucilaginibacter ginsenosidivorans]|uniref:HTTM domain-containing protein n=1 Tax=Mucilaginibacter ginsenosidivorans TaxID=398053 RepID=A0A5B8UTG9_9SPHI|nr:hypothetical protein [Mucilaginibacter ginsenosidivorans]QEC62015.1 hypothetical protein FRZ54_05230 [Mucilaginibacter ginsenosidivorans]
MDFPDLFNSAHGPNETGMFAKLFCAALAIQLLFSFRQQYRYFKTEPWKIYGRTQQLLGFIPLPALNQYQFLGSGLCMMISLVLVCIGFYPHIFIFIALVNYFLYFSQIISLAYVQRKTNLLPIVLLILLLSPSLDKSLAAPSTGWELLLVKIALVQVYFSAGLQKLTRSGLRWVNGKSLQAYLMENYLWSDKKSALVLAGRPAACMALSFLTLVFELTFWLVVFFPSVAFFYVAFAILFHTGTLITMRINYLKYMGPAYLVFFTDMIFRLKIIPGT